MSHNWMIFTSVILAIAGAVGAGLALYASGMS